MNFYTVHCAQWTVHFEWARSGRSHILVWYISNITYSIRLCTTDCWAVSMWTKCAIARWTKNIYRITFRYSEKYVDVVSLTAAKRYSFFSIFDCIWRKPWTGICENKVWKTIFAMHMNTNTSTHTLCAKSHSMNMAEITLWLWPLTLELSVPPACSIHLIYIS